MTHSKHVNDDVKLRLFESITLSLLTYDPNVISFSAGDNLTFTLNGTVEKGSLRIWAM